MPCPPTVVAREEGDDAVMKVHYPTASARGMLGMRRTRLSLSLSPLSPLLILHPPQLLVDFSLLLAQYIQLLVVMRSRWVVLLPHIDGHGAALRGSVHIGHGALRVAAATCDSGGGLFGEQLLLLRGDGSCLRCPPSGGGLVPVWQQQLAQDRPLPTPPPNPPSCPILGVPPLNLTSHSSVRNYRRRLRIE
jgi:hypothetical protein